jgi:hypothetical protein
VLDKTVGGTNREFLIGLGVKENTDSSEEAPEAIVRELLYPSSSTEKTEK